MKIVFTFCLIFFCIYFMSAEAVESPASRKAASVQRYLEKRKERYYNNWAVRAKKWNNIRRSPHCFLSLSISHISVRWRFKWKRKVEITSSASLDIYLNDHIGTRMPSDHASGADLCFTRHIAPTGSGPIQDNIQKNPTFSSGLNDKGDVVYKPFYFSGHSTFKCSTITFFFFLLL